MAKFLFGFLGVALIYLGATKKYKDALRVLGVVK